MSVLVLIWPVNSSASSIDQADIYFQQKQYQLALKQYMDLADVGNARAYYQLGAMYYNGLGIEASSSNAVIWFALAAESNFENSAEIVADLLSRASEPDRVKLEEIITVFKDKYGKQGVQRKYFPEFKQGLLEQKIVFGGGDSLDPNYIVDDELSLPENDDFETFDEENFGEDELSNEDPFASSANSNKLNLLINRPYMLVVDYDIEPDGSRRYFEEIQTIGNPKKGLEDLSNNNAIEPTFNGKKVSFIQRSYLGIANYNKFEVREQYNFLYSKVRKYVRHLADSENPVDKYNYAMALLNFTWLTQEEGQAEALLKSSADAGVALAQLEYGLLLYREQRDIKLGIEFITKAAQQGLIRAEYRLGKIILDSPWVVNDNKKALFWLDNAAQKEHIAASLKAANLKLIAKDKTLLDVSGAIDYLDRLSATEQANPEYHYLQALAHNNMRPRKLSVAVTYIREAIAMGEDRDWDVTHWQNTLKRWTSGGSVTIVEMDSD
ncbi:tetratricopeptide repeat protein [Thalassomonas sp. M1454]|uniref:tetratricopeptide repeat protein n=1 Tax=Thalassomonas sp. M1454 TaxID=2594477 RepID=UPI00117DB5A4|nr:SEL1-like repeat protein [Thalassomonas sp. M1454]TRX53162.1 SEL1-like repeat protein [Thalassomonas sp. M1454]